MRTKAGDIAFERPFHGDVARAPCGRAAPLAAAYTPMYAAG